ncbi:MAG: Na/Pi cotransporter family protein [Candidatus Adiutrix sp.]|nr:Na/Pi cotransporter family protein [Candidatus Adiutrix sp.]
MDWHLVIFNTVGGLGMFIYGMTIMSDCLQRIAGERLKSILAAVSGNRLAACLTGLVITGIIQSSSATTVMLVGFVNAGLMNLTQAVGVALGAKIGTTVTGQLLAFNIAEVALPAVALGTFMRVFCGNRNAREIGGIILGFGFLFFGMELMKAGVSPFKDSGLMVDFFTRFDANSFGGIVLCILVGTGCTMIVQSSSVTVGLTMALATQGLLTLPGAAALVLGDNIGTTITAELAALKTDVAARRTARANSICSIIGASYMALLFPFYVDLVVWLTQLGSSLGPADLVVDGIKPNIARYVANAHSIFNVINSAVFLVALPLLVKAAIALTAKGKEPDRDDLMAPMFLDEGSLKTPMVALSQSRKEIVRMAEISRQMAADVFPAFVSRKRRDMNRPDLKEEALDGLQRSIHRYLVQLYGDHNSPEEQELITTQMTMVNAIERLGDTTTNIAELISSAIDNNVQLSGEAMGDYRQISDTALEFYDLVVTAFKENRVDILPRAKELEERLDQMRLTMRDGHLTRLREGVCNVDQGLVFTDMLNYFERLGDYLLKISRAWVEQAATTL